MSKEIVVRAARGISRNAYCYEYKCDPATGRHLLIAKGGVPKLAGRVVTQLLKTGGCTKEDLVKFFWNNKRTRNGLSINENDFSQVFKLLKSLGCVTSTRGRNATWTLTSKGAAVFRSAKVEWIGKK
ncbi:hypothetical protein UFOVP1290_160 [uncultured Caudovirales phage]|uniref:Uncharacterized protein n=1 Tax=uncultured Caudovirales phage TaxID=2100421 RepID=A0A6J5RGF9_9CAUD|nr:hypothetical protein UFOVP1290_160 [uncultured Caudovirales phage]